MLSIFRKSADGEKPVMLDPTIQLEKHVAEQIFNALQGPVVTEVMRQLQSSGSDVYLRSSMEGHSLKVDKELLPDMYELCQSVKAALGFNEPVDFYITGDSSVNAFSVGAEEDGHPHIVNINSGLLSLMTDDELRFVVGHELGHLINKDSALVRLINFVFPEATKAPISLLYKIRLHDQLAELVADRYGYIAAGNLEACVTAFFKMASGLDLRKMKVSIDVLLKENLKHLEYFISDKGVSLADHPVNPIRVQAINLFANCESQEELEKQMEDLIEILLKVGDGEQDEHLARFIATAGLIVANTDETVSCDEVDMIIEHLSSLKIFPLQFIEEIQKGDVAEIFNDSVSKLLAINPGLREGMLNYMIGLVISDKDISKVEIDMITYYGGLFGFSNIEIADMIAEAIQQNFTPSIASIC